MDYLGILGGLVVLDALLIGDDGVVHLHHDLALQEVGGGGQAGDQAQADVGPVDLLPAPEGDAGDGAHVDAQEVEVDARQGVGAELGDSGLELGGVLGHDGGGGDLVIVAVAAEQVGVDALDDLHDLGGNLFGLAQDVDDGVTDDGVIG